MELFDWVSRAIRLAKPDRSVFICYRREGGADTAQAISVTLERLGFETFLDVNKLISGRFDETLFREIEARSNFLIILSKLSLERCTDPEDWLRRELAHAIRTGRNIIPLAKMDFACPARSELPTDICDLVHYQFIRYAHDDFGGMSQRIIKSIENAPKARAEHRARIIREGAEQAQPELRVASQQTERERKALEASLAVQQVELERKEREASLAAQQAERERKEREASLATQQAERDRKEREVALAAEQAERKRKAHDAALVAQQAEHDRKIALAAEKAEVARRARNLALAPQKPSIAKSKVGRNDLCPCGSGKKYKKCHGFVAASSSNSTFGSNDSGPKGADHTPVEQSCGRELSYTKSLNIIRSRSRQTLPKRIPHS